MDFLNPMTEVINYIEEHLRHDFELGHLSTLVGCSAYQFGRIFSYVVGISLATLELQSGKTKVIDTAFK